MTETGSALAAGSLAGCDGAPAAADGTLERLEERLRAGVREGSPVVSLAAYWDLLGDWAEGHAETLIEIVDRAAAIDRSVASWDGAQACGVAVGLVGPRGRVEAANSAFASWIGDPSASIACMRLLRKAFHGRRALGLVDTCDHGVLSVCAITGPEVDRWRPLLGAGAPPSSSRGVAVLVALAPSRSQAGVQQAGAAYGMNRLEADLVAALVNASSVEQAAERVGVAVETARRAVSAAVRKTGVARAGQLVSRVLDLDRRSGDPAILPDGEAAQALGLSPTEARVAQRLAAGQSAREVSAALALTPSTVATYRRTIFSKTGLNRSRDLARLLTEIEGLERLTSAAEVSLDDGQGAGRIRLTAAEGGRHVASLDYGPAHGRPVALFHGANTGFHAPPPLLAALQAAGRRVIVVHRPGFGLTCAAQVDQLEQSTSDLALVLDALGCGQVEIISRSSSSSLSFAAARPERVKRLVLNAGQTPRSAEWARTGPLTAISHLLMRHPALIDPFARMLVRQSRSDLIEAILRRVAADAEADRLCLMDPETMSFLVRDIRALLGRTVAGFVAERRIYAEGWRPPARFTGENVVLAAGEALDEPLLPWAWPSLTQARHASLAGAGWFAPFTHAQALVDLLDRD